METIESSGGPSSQAARIGQWLFKRRGFLLVPWVAAILFFSSPSTLSLACGIILVLAGEALRIWAIGYSGGSTRNRSLTASALTTDGPYRFVRNPIYIGNFIMWLGFTVMAGLWRISSAACCTGGCLDSACGLGACLHSGCSCCLVVLGPAFLAFLFVEYLLIVDAEEAFLLEKFKTDYQHYCKRVHPWLPLRPPFESHREPFDLPASVKSERATFISIICLLACLLVISLIRRPGPISELELLYFWK